MGSRHKDWYTGALLGGPRDMWPWVITLAAAVNLGAERAAQIFACSAFAYLALAFVTSVAWMNRPDRAGRRIFAMPSEVGLAAGLLLATAVVVFLLPMLLFGSAVEALYRGFSHEPISGDIQGSRQDLTGYGTKFQTAAHLAGSIRGDLHVQAPNAAGRSSDV